MHEFQLGPGAPTGEFKSNHDAQNEEEKAGPSKE